MLHLLMVGVTRLLIGQGKRNSEWMELIQKVVGLNNNSVFSFEFKPPLESQLIKHFCENCLVDDEHFIMNLLLNFI